MSMDPAAGTGISSCGVVGMYSIDLMPPSFSLSDPPAGAGAAAGKVPMAAAAVAPGAVVVAAAPAAAKPAVNWWKKNLRRRWAQALFVLGCAAAALAFFSINSSSPTATADSRGLLGSCAPTDAEAAALRYASEVLLALAAAQLLAATTALLVPEARQVARFLSLVGWQTGYRAAEVLLKLFAGHGRVHAVVARCYFILQVLVLVGYIVGSAMVDSSYDDY